VGNNNHSEPGPGGSARGSEVVMSHDDVRMRGFRQRSDAWEARRKLLESVRPLQAETVSLWQAVGRVLAARCPRRPGCSVF
jgi:hypothetical protein